MIGANEREAIGAWVIHYGRKLVLDANGPAEYPAIDEAAKAATLLTKLGQTNQAIISGTEVRAIAIASCLNARYELNSLIQLLQKRRLIEQSVTEVSLLGVTPTARSATLQIYTRMPNRTVTSRHLSRWRKSRPWPGLSGLTSQSKLVMSMV
ncbi:MAG: hypothetical protein EOQ98_06670 [Mesorhizobium sp.]|uniref:hypothetical protein n=1 Tax=Mesorhizobium sp. TaxID=1871066 RepID=UPI000FE86760|nr:hypothetical protein [Mesorhizobium sp.]RWP01367.1 MAG: hypothetical protein EOQ98_06670 [Mesorhizobium sp.]TIM51654.1 MAG: hypothetical protein E5Y69_04460 [Mesorhizobium sp.]